MKSLKKWESIVDEISDERGNGDGIWLYLKKEYADFDFDPYHPTRQIHEQTVRKILSRINFGKSVRKITDEEFLKYPHLRY